MTKIVDRSAVLGINDTYQIIGNDFKKLNSIVEMRMK